MKTVVVKKEEYVKGDNISKWDNISPFFSRFSMVKCQS